MAAFDHVMIEIDGGVAMVTLNRPEKLNAFDRAMCDDVVGALEQVTQSSQVRAIILTGTGRAFCAGADLGVLATDGESLVAAGKKIALLVRSARQPVLAAVNGAAAGGGANLALACDLRIASDRASIGQTFSLIGLHPDWGATYFLPRLVGTSRAFELFAGGDMVGAEDALRLGLFNRVVPHERLATETRALASELAGKPPLALALAKKAVYASESHSLSQMLDLELEHQLRCFASRDAREGFAAFLEKRSPSFQGK